MQFDISQPATYVPILAGVVIPFFVALLTKADASGTVKSALSALAAALTALALYLDDGPVHTWEGAGSAFVLALIIAGASRVTLTEDKVEKVQAKGGFIG